VVYQQDIRSGLLRFISHNFPVDNTGFASMDLVRRALKRLPSTHTLPLKDELRPKSKFTSRLAFFRRPLRLRGNSSISVPLGVVLLFPCIVVVCILVLFVRHPSSPVRSIMPAGSPPAIRYSQLVRWPPSRKKLTPCEEKLVKSTIRCS
jgi:hypothetical protein